MWLKKQDPRIRFLVCYWLIVLILIAGVVYGDNLFGFLPFLLLTIATLPLGVILPGYLHGGKSAVPIAGLGFALINSYVFFIIATLRLRKKS